MPRTKITDIGFFLVAILITLSIVIFYAFYTDDMKTPSEQQVEQQSKTIKYYAAVTDSNELPKSKPEPKVKSKPKPESKPEPTAEPEPSEREKAEESVSRSYRETDFPALMITISNHESGGNYRAYNPTGCSDGNGTFSCGGRWQLSAQYASVWAERAGFNNMSSNAETWAPEIQDAVALYLFNETNGGLWCDYTTYC